MVVSDTILKEITSKELSIYKSFFKAGLEEDEEHFRIAPEDDAEAAFPTEARKDSFTLGVFVDGQLAGTVSFMRDGVNRVKLRHKGTLFRMFVSKKYRGLGIGKKLMEAVIARVHAETDIEQINLTVVARNHTAKQLYEKYGFKVFSVEEHAIKWKGKYFTEEQLVLRLR